MPEVKNYAVKGTEIPAGAEISCVSVNVADNGGLIINYDMKVPNKYQGNDPYADKCCYEYRKEVFTTYDEMTKRLMELCGMMGVKVNGGEAEAAEPAADESME